MKTRLNENSNARGSVLMVTLMSCGILGILMGSYLYLVKQQNQSVARGQAWNRALTVAEAGVEEAMAHLNSGVVSGNNWAVNTWTSNSAGIFIKSNAFGDSSYSVTIKTKPAVATDPVIISTASVPVPLKSARVSRTVVVQTQAIGGNGKGAGGAMVVSTTVDFKGFGINTDSFNSTNKILFPGGLYNSANAQDNGDVWSMSASTNAVNVGNGKIKGTVHTGVGGQVQVSSGGSVGDNAYVNGGNSGIQTSPKDHHATDATTTFPDAALPNTGGKLWLSPAPGSYKINGVTYKYLLNNSSPWKLPVIDGSVYVNGSDVKVWVTGDANGDGVQIGTKGEIRIPALKDASGNDYSIEIFMGAAQADLGGNGIINDTGVAKNFEYFGLPTNTELTFGANAAFVGQIYAPNAIFTLGGGGKNTYDFVGQSVTLAAKMNGHFNFHYDEASPGYGSGGPSTYKATSWDEP